MSFKSIYFLLEEKERELGIEKLTLRERMERTIKLYNESEGDLHLADGYKCSVCKNKGFIGILDENCNEYRKLCECQKIRTAIKRAERSGLGNIIKENTFNKFRDYEAWQKELKKKAMFFCKDDKANWFYVGGQSGCGKTHICTAIAAHYIKAGRKMLYMLWSEDAKRLKALVNSEGYQAKVKEFKEVDVLYIDDFLKVKNGEEPTAADINLAFEIINHRLLDDSKVTIISSEKTLDELMDYDEATMSRIYQKTGQYKFNIGKDRSKNYRLRG